MKIKMIIMGMVSILCLGIINASEIYKLDVNEIEKIIINQDKNSEVPVKLSSKGINSMEDLKNSQYSYIAEHYEEYELIGGYTTKQGNTFIRSVLIEKDGKTITVKFDVTECFRRLKSKNKDIRKEISDLEKSISIPENSKK